MEAQIDIKRAHRWIIAWAELLDGLAGVLTLGYSTTWYWPLSLRARGWAFRQLQTKTRAPHGLMETWIVVDKRTGKPASVAGFSSRESVLRKIEEWKRRQERGGRPDISREFLDNMEPRLHQPWLSETNQSIENAPQFTPVTDETTR